MKTGTIITRDELIQLGWNYITSFSFLCEVWGKDERRILWNRKTNTVEKSYTSDSRYATGGWL